MKYLNFAFIIAFLLSKPLTAEHKTPRITVVGAGLAGLTFAYELEKSGFDVQVVEARHRPGGRVFTAHIGEAYEEFGGKCFEDGGDAVHIRRLVMELGLDIQRCTLVTGKRQTVVDGAIVPASQLFQNAPKPDTETLTTLLSAAQSADSLGDILEPVFPSNTSLRQFLNHRNENYEGRPSEKLSPLYFDSFWSFYQASYFTNHNIANSYSCDHVKGGNGRLAHALARSLKHKVRYGMALVGIEHSDKKDTLTLNFADQSSFETDMLVLAIPGSKYRDLEFPASLVSAEQLTALQSVQMGTNAKILVPIQVAKDEPFMPTASLSFPWFNHDQTILTLYFGGDRGIFNASRADEILATEQVYLQQVCPSMAFPKGLSTTPMTEARAYGGPVAISWINEEFSKGSYPCFGVGQAETFNTFVTEKGVKFRKPFRPIANKIFFAGEHTSVNIPSTMEGAVDSGVNLAKYFDLIFY